MQLPVRGLTTVFETTAPGQFPGAVFFFGSSERDTKNHKPGTLNPPKCPSGKVKIDYYDTQLPGFLLEVRINGRAHITSAIRTNMGALSKRE